KSLHGLTRALIQNLVTGVEKGWEKRLELVGVGFRASSDGQILNLTVGYSHPVEIKAPEGVKFAVEENTKITVTGIDKNLVGQVAANIRKVRPPEPYQGKGIRYSGEYVRRKQGKAGKVGAGVK
ncbi:50S ribosomal protein L6, partial [Candidatus Daviesbacteria bacterium]|nr:50S ribosomal protein L6 [Candidatus Daviesbacteria bacterium]